MSPNARPFVAIAGVLALAGGLAMFFAASNVRRAGATDVLPATNVARPIDEFRALLQAGNHGRAIELARSWGGPDSASDENGHTALRLAVELGSTDDIRALLSAGASVNRADGKGRTPLMLAAERRDLAMVLALLDAGAQPNAIDSEGRDALARARARTDAEAQQIVAVLSNAGQ